MKKTTNALIIIILTLLTFQIVFPQEKNTEYQKIIFQIDYLKTELNQIKQDETALHNLKKDIINDKLDYQKIENKVEESHKGFVSDQLKFWTTLAAIFGGLVGFFTIFISWKDKIKKEIDKQVEDKTKLIIKDKYNTLEKALSQINKHDHYKRTTKIIIINKKGSDFPEYFKTILNLFNINVDDTNNRIDIESITDLTNNDYIELKKAKIVLIENKLPDGEWKPEEYNKAYVKLANEVCSPTTGLLYFGNGRFPESSILPEKQPYVSYTNVASQLYGNMLNLIKYINELEIRELKIEQKNTTK